MATDGKAALAPASHGLYVTRTSRRRASSTRTSSGCRWWRPGARRTSCSARSARTATCSSGSATAARSRSSSSRTRRTRNSSDRRCRSSPFHHIALNVDKETQAGIEKRLKAAGYKQPQTYVLEHGYCRSVYVTGSERPDRRVHARPSGCREDQQGARSGCTPGAQALARRRSHVEQHLSPVRGEGGCATTATTAS